MSIPQMRKFLKGLSQDEWRQVLQCAYWEWAAAVQSGAKHTHIDEKAVRKWVLVPQQSNRLLELPVKATASALLPEGEEGESGHLPTDPDELRDWLLDVTATRGSGPAKVCLLAVSASSDPAMTSREVEELFALIEESTLQVLEDAQDSMDTHAVKAPAENCAADSGSEVDAQATAATTDDPDLDDLEASLASLQSDATAVATQLRDAAAEMEAGRVPGFDPRALILEYLTDRTTFLQELSRAVGRPEPDDFDECHALLDAERWTRDETRRNEQEAAERSRTQHVETLRNQIQQLDVFMATAEPSLVAGLQAAKSAAQRALSALGVDPDRGLEDATEARTPDGKDGLGSPLEGTTWDRTPSQGATSRRQEEVNDEQQTVSSEAGTSPRDGLESEGLAEVDTGVGSDDDRSASAEVGPVLDEEPTRPPIEDRHDGGPPDAETWVEADPTSSTGPSGVADNLKPNGGLEDFADGADSGLDEVPVDAAIPSSDAASIQDAERDEGSSQELPAAGATTSPSSLSSADEHRAAPFDSEPFARLVAQGRSLAAAWLARASGVNELLADALTFNGVAYASGADTVPPADALLIGADLQVESLADNRPAAIAAMTGAARAGLAAGWTAGHLLDGLLGSVHLEPEWQAMMTEVAEVSHHGYQHTSSTRSPNSEISRTDFADRARTLAVEISSATTKYHRATRVLRHMGRTDEPLGAALQALVAWSEGDDTALLAIRERATELRTPRSRSRAIDAADERVSTPQQRRNDIVAGAAQQLYSHIDQVTELLTMALEASVRPRAGASDEAAHLRLISAARSVSAPDATTDLETALLAALRAWIIDPSAQAHEAGRTVEELLWRASLPLLDVRRDSTEAPELDGVSFEGVTHALLNTPSIENMVEAYIARGNLRAAAALAEQEPRLLDRVSDAKGDWGAQLSGLVREAETQLIRARSHYAMADQDVSEAEGRLAALAVYQGDRYDLQVEQIDVVKGVVSDSLRQECDRLRAALEVVEQRADHDDVKRVSERIEAGDLSTAREYIFQLEHGVALPNALNAGEEHLESFNAIVSSLSPDNRRAQDVYERLADGSDHDGLVGKGLQSWTSIVLNPLRQSRTELPDLLALVGLESDRSRIQDISAPGTKSAKVFDVRAQPRDGSIVPGLGSRANGQYFVTVASSQRLDPEQALSLIPESRRDQANLMLVPQLLSQQERRQFLRAARTHDVKVLIVDSACVGYVAGTSPGSFRTLQQITLPYATYTHYTPFVAGDVPEEVFVGRTHEAQQIIDPAGSLFVYGGRQLGKSALLRHIARTTSDGRSRHAIYVDLKAKMIGEAQDPAHLWVVLLEEFKHAGIIGPKVTSGTAKSVVEHTKTWLLEDETRRILLLLDEADLFLESEARQRREGQRVVRFANISPLKDLMESTSRRFKPVFAGLHQVQRFHEISNTPLAHGGNDILIGPLDRSAAFDLVEKPFAALGYRFESRDLVSRLLAFTNYQASLVQIVCDHLARRMARRMPGDGQPPVTITSAEVDRVTEDRGVRHQLAERFRLTIALEDRYLVIALVVAWLSFEDNFTEAYEPTEIFAWCRDYWPLGFTDMTSREFRLYLEEMDGLGVLVHRTDGRIAVRSPNVVSMLGKQTELEQQLLEGSERFELPHDYNPRVSRRITRIGTRDVRSPLTEQDLQILLPKSGGATGLHLVLGSAALGVELVADVLEAVADERDRTTTRVDAGEFGGWVTTSGGSSRRDRDALPIVDATRLHPGKLETLLDLARRTTERRAGQSIIVIVGSAAAGSAQSWQPPLAATVTILTRWNDEALRSINDAVFVGIAEYRAAILEATSGWPALIEEVLRRGGEGEPLRTIVESLDPQNGTSSAAMNFLGAVGVGDDVDRLKQWTEVAAPGEAVDPKVLEELFPDVPDGAFADLAGRLAVLQVVSGEPGALVLDPVVHRALLQSDR